MFGLLSKKTIRVRLPDNVRVVAIGDIHGQLDRLSNVMDQVEAYRQKKPVSQEHIIFLGDYSDRGPHSAPVVEYLCNRLKDAKNKPHQEIFLKGNHEELLLDALGGEPRRVDVWWRNGGKQSIESYLEFSGQPLDNAGNQEQALELFRTGFPPKHQKFYDRLENMYQVGPLLFVHAGIRMDLPAKDQQEEDLYWIRGPFLNWRGLQKDYLVVHGHTITPNFKPEIRPHRIGLDTGSYRAGGKITAAVFEKDKVRFFGSGSKANFGNNPFE